MPLGVLCHYGNFSDDTSYEQVNQILSWMMDEFIHWPKLLPSLVSNLWWNIVMSHVNLAAYWTAIRTSNAKILYGWYLCRFWIVHTKFQASTCHKSKDHNINVHLLCSCKGSCSRKQNKTKRFSQPLGDKLHAFLFDNMLVIFSPESTTTRTNTTLVKWNYTFGKVKICPWRSTQKKTCSCEQEMCPKTNNKVGHATLFRNLDTLILISMIASTWHYSDP